MKQMCQAKRLTSPRRQNPREPGFWRRRRRCAGALLALLLGVGACRGEDFPVSTNPPGGLAPADVPQIVLLSFDDTVNSQSFALVQSVLTNHFNPNGQAIQATFFVTLSPAIDYPLVNRLFAAGHEIAAHTMTHQTSTNSLEDQWRRDIVGCRNLLSRWAAIPATDIRGFRAPFFKCNDASFKILHERGFDYDSSLPESIAGFSLSPASMIWPYTMDHGVQQAVEPQYAPQQPYPGLLEIPIWCQINSNRENRVATSDPPDTYGYDEVLSMWKTNFLWHYEGNRAPFTIALHAVWANQWLSDPSNTSWRVAVLNEFIEWALHQPGVYFLTYSGLQSYLRTPVPLADVPSHPIFQTSVRSANTNVVTGTYPGHTLLSVCGATLPPAFPDITNFFWNYTAAAGGAVHFQVNSQQLGYTYAEFTVSNDTLITIYDWQVDFTVSSGQVSQLYDGSWTQVLSQVSVQARQYNKQLAPGGSRSVQFRVSATNSLEFLDGTVTLHGLGPQATRIHTVEGPMADGRIKLAWNETALFFDVVTNADFSDSWHPVVTNLPAPTYYFNPPPAWSGSPLLLRVKGYE